MPAQAQVDCLQSYSIAEANMLYLEAPIGVGFSYSADDSSYEAVNDKITGTTLSNLNPFSPMFTHFNVCK